MVSMSVAAFADQLTLIMPEIMKEFARKMTALKCTTSLPQFLVMEYVDKHGPVNMKALAKYMGVSTAAVTGIIARLVSQGYVQRVYDPGDRRIIMVKLRAGGESLVRKMHLQRRDLLIRIFGKISEGDRRDYLRILTQIKDILEKESK